MEAEAQPRSRSNADWMGARAFVLVLVTYAILLDGWLCGGLSYALLAGLIVGIFAWWAHRKQVLAKRRRWLVIGVTAAVWLLSLLVAWLMLPGRLATWTMVGAQLPAGAEIIHVERRGIREPAAIAVVLMTHEQFQQIVSSMELKEFEESAPQQPDVLRVNSYRNKVLAAALFFEHLIPWDNALSIYQREVSRDSRSLMYVLSAIWDDTAKHAYFIRSEF